MQINIPFVLSSDAIRILRWKWVSIGVKNGQPLWSGHIWTCPPGLAVDKNTVTQYGQI